MTTISYYRGFAMEVPAEISEYLTPEQHGFGSTVPRHVEGEMQVTVPYPFGWKITDIQICTGEGAEPGQKLYRSVDPASRLGFYLLGQISKDYRYVLDAEVAAEERRAAE